MTDCHLATLFAQDRDSVGDSISLPCRCSFFSKLHTTRILLSLSPTHRTQNAEEIARARVWRTRYPKARVVVTVFSKTSATDGSIVVGVHPNTGRYASAPLLQVKCLLSLAANVLTTYNHKIMQHHIYDLLPSECAWEKRAVLIIYSNGRCLTLEPRLPELGSIMGCGLNHVKDFSALVGFTRPTVSSAQVFPSVLRYIHAIANGLSPESALQDLVSPYLLRQSPVLFMFGDAKKKFQAMYLFTTHFKPHHFPWGLLLPCSQKGCKGFLVGQTKKHQIKDVTEPWKLKCLSCHRQIPASIGFLRAPRGDQRMVANGQTGRTIQCLRARLLTDRNLRHRKSFRGLTSYRRLQALRLADQERSRHLCAAPYQRKHVVTTTVDREKLLVPWGPEDLQFRRGDFWPTSFHEQNKGESDESDEEMQPADGEEEEEEEEEVISNTWKQHVSRALTAGSIWWSEWHNRWTVSLNPQVRSQPTDEHEQKRDSSHRLLEEAEEVYNAMVSLREKMKGWKKSDESKFKEIVAEMEMFLKGDEDGVDKLVKGMVRIALVEKRVYRKKEMQERMAKEIVACEKMGAMGMVGGQSRILIREAMKESGWE
ncbi:hypothetical protein BXZ70DRAFT_911568 [Cristinia sonorae]|uniref:Uncharacterized protein n=1 Tax=Cristinia sonorae TaxID=1940300 RepID=A0A8K0UD16_9AGAR|nr:hypothetical protein BXZ70DRAFT_911568 [Cristinia sonorae]